MHVIKLNNSPIIKNMADGIINFTYSDRKQRWRKTMAATKDTCARNSKAHSSKLEPTRAHSSNLLPSMFRI